MRRACYRLFVSFVLFGAVVDHGDVDSVGVAVDIEGQHESDGVGRVVVGEGEAGGVAIFVFTVEAAGMGGAVVAVLIIHAA